MNPIRIICAVTIICAGMYSAAGLLVSLTQFGVGLAVAAAAVLIYGWVDFSEARDDEKRHRERVEVWRRRDLEATLRGVDTIENLYAHRRDGL